MDDDVINFYKKYNLPKGAIAVVMDKYSNLTDKLSIPTNGNKIQDALDKTDKKTIDNEQDLKKRWKKIAELKEKEKLTDVIQELNKIIQTKCEGYPDFIKAQQELDRIDTPNRDKYNTILKEFLAKDEKERDKEGTIKHLEGLLPDCRNLPTEGKIKETVAKIKKGEPVKMDESVKNTKPPEKKEVKDNKDNKNPEDEIDNLINEDLQLDTKDK